MKKPMLTTQFLFLNKCMGEKEDARVSDARQTADCLLKTANTDKTIFNRDVQFPNMKMLALDG